MYDYIYFEISGHCNAKCPWCSNGRGAISEETKKYISAKEFSNILQILISNKLIDQKTNINLFNWGEPFLNPELVDIIKIICDSGCQYSLSTNASKYIYIPNELQQNLIQLTISMPGFSQKSYSRIHQFSFEKIIKNIEKFINNINPRKINIAYHIYQFNLDEIEIAYTFFSKYGVTISPVYAFFNDYTLFQKFLTNNLPYDLLSKASKELVLADVDNLISECPSDYQCPEWNRLTIDEWGSIITCCSLPKDHPCYSLNISLNQPENILSEVEIRKAVRTQPVCKECIRSGLAYWGHNIRSPSFVEIYSNKFFFEKILTRYARLIRRVFGSIKLPRFF